MKQNLFQTIDIKTIPVKGLNININANVNELKHLSDRFDLPGIHSLSVSGEIKGDNILTFYARVKASIIQQCVVTLEKFDTHMDFEFKEYFSESGIDFAAEKNFDIDMEDDQTVELIKNGRLDVGEIVSQQFGLNLDPFPKKKKGYYEYKEAQAQQTRKPFADLKDLIKK